MKFSLEKDELVGIRTTDGGLVVSSTSKMVTMRDGTSHRLSWLVDRVFFRSESDHRINHSNTSILANALFWLATRKRHESGDCGWFRGMVICQVVFDRIRGDSHDSLLFTYEGGYRGTIWPRFFWVLPCEQMYPDAILGALLREVGTEELVAEVDTRSCATVSDGGV